MQELEQCAQCHVRASAKATGLLAMVHAHLSLFLLSTARTVCQDPQYSPHDSRHCNMQLAGPGSGHAPSFAPAVSPALPAGQAHQWPASLSSAGCTTQQCSKFTRSRILLINTLCQVYQCRPWGYSCVTAPPLGSKKPHLVASRIWCRRLCSSLWK